MILILLCNKAKLWMKGLQVAAIKTLNGKLLKMMIVQITVNIQIIQPSVFKITPNFNNKSLIRNNHLNN